ncbi:hypothetical protein [Sphingomonas bacterium]|uniref:hypothetical protein n=1 Tax=Sphingomonas bacterium TaxID=1895847 RepID=UPI00260D0374|nr:hypothetical protein [Sphingomonas bacterium]
MAGTAIKELIFEAHKGQAQFAYFLLGGSGGAIAYALHETAGISLADAPWPLGFAVAFWALSFALGCFGIDARQDGLLTNASFLRVFGDVPPQPANSPGAQVVDEATESVKKDLKKPVTFFRWQKWTLFAGALAYIAGHVLQMAAIPPAKPTSATPKPVSGLAARAHL